MYNQSPFVESETNVYRELLRIEETTEKKHFLRSYTGELWPKRAFIQQNRNFLRELTGFLISDGPLQAQEIPDDAEFRNQRQMREDMRKLQNISYNEMGRVDTKKDQNPEGLQYAPGTPTFLRMGLSMR